MTLDKVEKKKLTAIKEAIPEYADLELYQVAHLELKKALFERAREILKSKATDTMQAMGQHLTLVDHSIFSHHEVAA